MSVRDYGNAPAPDDSPGAEWVVRLGNWLVTAWRPELGWLVLCCCVALTQLPAWLLWQNHWLRVASLQTSLTLVGPVAVLSAWALLGWRRHWYFVPMYFRVVIQSISIHPHRQQS